MLRHAPPGDGSPARVIATMVGIVGILLLGSLAWSAVGALFSALGDATAVFTAPRPSPMTLAAVVVTATGMPTAEATKNATLAPTLAPTAVETPSTTPTIAPSVEPTLEPSPSATPPVTSSGRAPWVLLPVPAPDGRVSPGSLVVEARARGDAPISAIHLELDGAPLSVSLEQKSDSTWRGSATTRVTAGHHAVRAIVVDEQGRSGSFRWTFDASS